MKGGLPGSSSCLRTWGNSVLRAAFPHPFFSSLGLGRDRCFQYTVPLKGLRIDLFPITWTSKSKRLSRVHTATHFLVPAYFSRLISYCATRFPEADELSSEPAVSGFQKLGSSVCIWSSCCLHRVSSAFQPLDFDLVPAPVPGKPSL